MSGHPHGHSSAWRRWTPQRKAELVREVRIGKRTAEEVFREFDVEAWELAEWTQAYDLYGLEGLKVTGPNPLRAR